MNHVDGRFKTKWLQFACYLHCTKALRFLGTELAEDRNRVLFVFDDPMGEADNLEFIFSEDGQVSATKLFASLNYLRRQVSVTKERLGAENSHESHRRRSY